MQRLIEVSYCGQTLQDHLFQKYFLKTKHLDNCLKKKRKIELTLYCVELELWKYAKGYE